MTTAKRPTPPSLSDLTARFLARSMALPPQDTTTADVVPHEVGGGLRVDPLVSWSDAKAFAHCFGQMSEKLTIPPDWATYASLPTSLAVPLAGGSFPQMLRDTQPLFGTGDLAAFLPRPAAAVAGLSGLRRWITAAQTAQSPAVLLMASGLAAVIGDNPQAESLLTEANVRCQGDWRLAWENQRASLLWWSGQTSDALAAWQALGEHPVGAFNTGMALLFLGRATEAVPHLKMALDGLPPASGWFNLANLLFLAAQARG